MESVHQGGRIETAGAALDEAEAAVILLHGRGASALGILRLADELDVEGVAYVAPQAHRRTWYPQSFLAPIEQNEPDLTSALQVVGSLVEQAEADGPGVAKTVLIGFSQGACLATEYAARHPARYGGVVGLSGGLIGPEDDPLDYDGSLDGTPVFLGCDANDPYIPLHRVKDTAAVLEEMDADVETRIYDTLGHGVNDDEIGAVREIIRSHVPSP